jgi:hypothetical protein
VVIEPQIAKAAEDRIPVADAVPVLMDELVVKLTAVHLDDEPAIDQEVDTSHSINGCLRFNA